MYNKHNIMKNAWNIHKAAGVSMSIALRAAWALEKAMMQADKLGEESGWNHKVVTNDWVKGGKNRTYVEARIYTAAWNCKSRISVGYVDNMTGAFVAA